MAKSASQQQALRASKQVSKQSFTPDQPRGLATRHYGSAGSSNIQTTAPTSRSSASSVNNLRPSSIASRETYVLYQITKSGEAKFGERSGADLRNSIAYNKLTYDSKRKVYVSKQGKLYRIRKK